MDPFSFTKTEELNYVLDALNGLWFRPDFYPIRPQRKEGVKADSTMKRGAYILPVISEENMTRGFTTIDGKLADFPVGLTYAQSFSEKIYFGFANKTGKIIQEDKKEGVLYLPLMGTDKNFTEKGGHMNVSGSYGIFPLTYLFQTADLVQIYSVQKFPDSFMKDPEMRDHIRSKGEDQVHSANLREWFTYENTIFNQSFDDILHHLSIYAIADEIESPIENQNDADPEKRTLH